MKKKYRNEPKGGAMNEVSEEAYLWAKKRLKLKRKQATIVGYKLKYAKMLIDALTPGTATCPSTRLHERAAARFCIAEEIITAHAINDKAKIVALYVSILHIQSIADENQLAYLEGSWTGKKHFRDGKKASIHNLPDDWKDQILGSMNKHRYLNATRILACIGCRPSEIEKGIVVQHKVDGIYFDIQGAKVDGMRGQVWREIILPLDHPIASKINIGLYKAPSKSISETISRKAEKLGFKDISAYSFRHQFASDLKASGFNKRNIAEAMGHQAELTQETYGNSGAGRKISMKVIAEKKPRKVHIKSKTNLYKASKI